MAELYQRRFTLKKRICNKDVIFIESLISKEESVFQKRMIGKLLKGFQ